MYPLAVALLILIFAALTFLAVEIRSRTSGRLYISRKRFFLRIFAGLLLTGLLLGILLGLTVLRLDQPEPRPLLFLIYWFACIFITIILILLVLLELREVRVSEQRRQVELWRDIAKMLADNLPPKKKE